MTKIVSTAITSEYLRAAPHRDAHRANSIGCCPRVAALHARRHQQQRPHPPTPASGWSVEGVQWFGVGESQGVGHRRLGDLAAPHAQAVLQTPVGSDRFDRP